MTQSSHSETLSKGHRMSRFFLTLIGLVLLALPFVALGSEESCPVEGITERWAMSYCMTRFETDDDAHPGVSQCYLKELQQKLAGGTEEDCEANLAYKAAICSILVEWKMYEESLASCVASEEIVPSIVKTGIG
jgi:hypothetical protein